MSAALAYVDDDDVVHHVQPEAPNAADFRRAARAWFSRPNRLRIAAHAWFSRVAPTAKSDNYDPLDEAEWGRRGQGVALPQRMFAEDLAKRLGVHLRTASRMLVELEERTGHLDAIVHRAGDGKSRGRRYIDRDSLYRLERLLRAGALLDPYADELTREDGRRGPKSVNPRSELARLEGDQAKDHRRERVDVTMGMALLLGMSERGVQRGDRVDQYFYDEVGRAVGKRRQRKVAGRPGSGGLPPGYRDARRFAAELYADTWHARTPSTLPFRRRKS